MSEEQEVEQAKVLRTEAFAKIREAEKAAYAWFCACPVGDERVYASDVYRTILYSTRKP